MAATPLAYSSVLLLALTGVVIAVMVMGALELVPRTRWRNDHALRGQFLPPVGFAAGYECVVRSEGVRNPLDPVEGDVMGLHRPEGLVEDPRCRNGRRAVGNAIHLILMVDPGSTLQVTRMVTEEPTLIALANEQDVADDGWGG
jgi:hypothetical protein